MGTYIMLIDKNIEIPQAEIDRQRANHTNGQDGFLIKYVERTIPSGYIIKRKDDLTEIVASRHGIDTESQEVSREVAKQAKYIKDGGKYNRDQVILDGQQPYTPK